MPELPEVETIRRDLEPLLQHRTLQSIIVRDPLVLTGIGPKGQPRREITPSQFIKQILGRKIGGMNRRGKYLILEFADGGSLVFHLRMTGQILLSKPLGPWRAYFGFDGNVDLFFADRRRFGEVTFSEDWRKEPFNLAMGIEPTNGNLTAEYLKKHFQGRTANIHSILLNQNVIGGLGNIYATEALHLAGIKPSKSCGKIPLEKLKVLSEAIHKVVRESIEHRGYSMNTYVDAMGKQGKSQLFSQAYGKEGKPCKNCGRIFKRTIIGGRGVVWCPGCQK